MIEAQLDGDPPAIHPRGRKYQQQSEIVLEYHKEGGANVLYRIQPSAQGTIDPAHRTWINQLLRLRKDNISSISVDSYHRTIKKNFESDDIVRSELVICHPSIIDALNLELKQLEDDGIRPTKRLNQFISVKDLHGMLMPNMLAPAEGVYTIEMKPKWLLQSPTAPPNARRCRTCAKAARDNCKAPQRQWGGRVHLYCPLALVSDDEELVTPVIRTLFKTAHVSFENNALCSQDRIINLLTSYFTGSGDGLRLLKQLQDLQAKFDPDGAMGIAPDLEKLAFAMTLRDCSMFLRFSGDCDRPVEARLADLDPKPTEGKLSYWRKLEEQLTDEGWYTGTEKFQEIQKQDEVCLLWTRNGT
ncbi:hypothetical protein M501DRAFT_56339 [Patellaria atrata CBS 101060]|uniref:Inositol-pentakisphosphate 2-kinase n=1 Tax=Patellaria atrata CBS 101060 TaxID=1346257 RepID=A0A9P4VWU0_9PEZI|nr:hypothetical protein M501DRAFT_56339 [Patellaria atrata CBS 101060]